MKPSGFLQDLISTILDRGAVFVGASDGRPIDELCRELLSSRGEISSNRIGAAILDQYGKLDEVARLAFFEFLTEELDLNADDVERFAHDYRENPSVENLERLTDAAEPPRQELLRRLNHVPGATAALVSMRLDLLSDLRQHPALKRADHDFHHLLGSWFNRGFLVLRPISWRTPANVLAKIIQYEAVHAINDWDDLRRRLQPTDRRCFAFFHPSMQDEPLVFVEVALCKGIPTSVQQVLEQDRETLQESDADTAVFYSISNCQQGLRGISFGNSLIKKVVTDLSQQLPQLKTFVTLSPLPGFVTWLQEQDENMTGGLLTQQGGGFGTANLSELEKHTTDLKILAAKYLTGAKRTDGLPLDPVARFHLGNGATILDIHALADISANGVGQSLGMMVNYHYDLAKVEKHHEDFAGEGMVVASKAVQNLAAAKLSRMPAPKEVEE